MTAFKIKIERVETADRMYYPEPTIKFTGTIEKTGPDIIHLIYLKCDVRLLRQSILLGTVPIFLANIPLSPQTKPFEFTLGFSIDSNNRIHDLIKDQKLKYDDDIDLDVQVNGFYIFSRPDQQAINVMDHIDLSETIRTVGLYVGKYNILLSQYYKNITWIPISIETRRKLEEFENKTGLMFDEIILELLNSKESKV